MRNSPDRRPFGRTQESKSETRYVGYWKQMLYYCFRTCLLEPELRQRVYGIQFTNEQERLIIEITALLQAYNDGNDEDSDWESEEYSDLDDEDEDEESENEDESGRTQRRRIPPAQRSALNQRHDDTLSEKLFHLCVTFLTQRFEQGDGRQTPLMHFSSVLGIDLKSSKFRKPRIYTPILAGLIWVGRLLLLEYALPNREFRSLQWPSREAYHDHDWRLEELRRAHLIEGSYSPVSHLIGLLAYGKYVVKTQGRAGLIHWDEDFQGLSSIVDRN